MLPYAVLPLVCSLDNITMEKEYCKIYRVQEGYQYIQHDIMNNSVARGSHVFDGHS